MIGEKGDYLMEKTAGLEGTIRDLTQRKLDEFAFRQLSVDHKAIIDHAPAMIWYKDTKNTFHPDQPGRCTGILTAHRRD